MSSTVPSVPKLFGNAPRSASSGSRAGRNRTPTGHSANDELHHLSAMANNLPNSTRGAATPPRPRSARLFGDHTTGATYSGQRVTMDSADELLVQTQRTLERTLREKHELQRTMMRLEGQVQELEDQLAKQPYHNHSGYVDANGGEGAGLNEETIAAFTRASDFVCSLYDDAPCFQPGDQPNELVEFLLHRVRDLQLAEHKIGKMEEDQRAAKTEFEELSEEWSRAEEQMVQQQVEIEQLRSQLSETKRQNSMHSLNGGGSPISGGGGGSSGHSPINTRASPQQAQQSPKKPLAEQLKIDELLEGVRETVALVATQVEASRDPFSPLDPESGEGAAFVERFAAGQQESQRLMHDVRIARRSLEHNIALIHANHQKSVSQATSENNSPSVVRKNNNSDNNSKSGARIAELEAELAVVQKDLSEALGFGAEVASLEKEREDLRRQLRAAETEVQSAKKAQSSASAQQERETASLQEELESAHAKLNSVEKAHRQEIASYEALKTDLQEQLAAADEQNQRLQDSKDQEDNIARELHAVREDRQQLQDEVDELKGYVTAISNLFGAPLDNDLVEQIAELREQKMAILSGGASLEVSARLDYEHQSQWYADSLVHPLPEPVGVDESEDDLPPRVELEDVFEWSFDTARRVEDVEGGPLYQVGWNVALKLNLFALVDELTWRRFLLTLQSGYRDVPYHNATHAADIVHTVTTLLKMAGVAEKMTDLELLAVVIGAAAHDFQHPGRNNLFLTKIHDPIALRYNDMSVLENHHTAATFALLRHAELDVLNELDLQDAMAVRKMIIKFIAGTDMSLHNGHLATFVERITSANNGYDLNKSEDRLEVVSLLFHAGDISNPTKEISIAEQWAHRVSAEFRAQGQDEIDRGLPVSMNCDPKVTNIAPSQLGFYDYVILPMYQALAAEFPALQLNVDNALDGREFWARQSTAPTPPPAPRSFEKKSEPGTPVGGEDQVPKAVVVELQRLLAEQQELSERLAEENITVTLKATNYAEQLAAIREQQ